MPAVRDVCSIPILQSDVEFPHRLDSPKEVGHYSIDADGDIHYNRSLMRYYIPRKNANLSLDLNVGYENAVKAFGNYSNRKQFEYILQWIKHVKFEPLLRSSVDFVCSRGCIQCLLCAPYNDIYDTTWTLKASKLNGVIYIAYCDDNAEEENVTEKMKRMYSWGYKFEEYMTADVPNGDPDVASSTHEVESFNVMLQKRIGLYNLLIKAEIDGAKSIPVDGDASYYVETKTSRITSSIYRYGFQRKMLDWWAQSVVAGIEDNVCGFRDDDGIVRQIEVFKTSEIPRYTWRSWSPNVCYNFCHRTLEYLKKNLPENPKSSVKFVCPRGCIQVLLCAPYKDTFWKLKASKLNGVIYISHVDDTSKARSLGRGNSREMETIEKRNRRDFWGCKFEEYMTADVPNGVPDVSSTTHKAKSFNVMLQNRIGPYNLLIKAETDGVKAIPTDGDTSYYVEFKIIENSEMTSNINPKKMRKWWARSVVAGIEDIICGFRDDCGIVHSIEVFKTSEIPNRTPSILSPKLCYNFCCHILKYLEENLPEDHKVEFKLEYKGDKSHPVIYVSKFVYSDGEEALLPGWYVDELKKHQNYSRP